MSDLYYAREAIQRSNFKLNDGMMETSPEVLTNSWLSVPLDIPNKREASVNMSLARAV